MSLLFTYIKQNILIILVDSMLVYKNFFCYSDPDQRFLKWIRIQTNDTDFGKPQYKKQLWWIYKKQYLSSLKMTRISLLSYLPEVK